VFFAKESILRSK